MSDDLNAILQGLKKAVDEQRITVKQITRLTHTHLALVTAALIDEQLGKALERKMIPLSSTMRRSLFEGYGVLAYAGNRIDLAYAFGIIDQVIYQQVRVVNKIRVAFAHSPTTVTFHDPAIIDLVKRIPTEKPRDYSVDGECQQTVKDVLNRLALHLAQASASP